MLERASIMASATLRLPRDQATALQHWRQEACEDSDVMLRGHPGPRWYARPMLFLLGFRMVRSDGRIHALGRFHISGVAYCVWALPPKAGATAHRYISWERAASCATEELRAIGKGNMRAGHWRGGKASRA